jgi:hypothetical protein
MYCIMGREQGAIITIDSADNIRDAVILAGRYARAFGWMGQVWIKPLTKRS